MNKASISPQTSTPPKKKIFRDICLKFNQPNTQISSSVQGINPLSGQLIPFSGQYLSLRLKLTSAKVSSCNNSFTELITGIVQSSYFFQESGSTEVIYGYELKWNS